MQQELFASPKRSAESLLEHAMRYSEMGLSIISVNHSKIVAIALTRYQSRRATVAGCPNLRQGTQQ